MTSPPAVISYGTKIPSEYQYNQPMAKPKLLETYLNPKYYDRVSITWTELRDLRLLEGRNVHTDMVPPGTGRWAATSVTAVMMNKIKIVKIM